MQIASTQKSRHLVWLVSLLLLILFSLGDAAVVAWSAKLLSGGQLAAGAISFLLIAWGGVVTVWKLDR